MKKDIGFWDINGNYIEDIQEIDERELTMENKLQKSFEILEEMTEMADSFLRYEPTEEPTAKEKITAIYDKIQDIFENDIYTYSVEAESDEGYYMTEVTTLPEDSLLEVRKLIDEIMDIVEAE